MTSISTVTIPESEYLHLKEIESRHNRVGVTVNQAYIRLYTATKTKMSDRTQRRKLVDDLKWALGIRHISNITNEQLPAALEYVSNWTFKSDEN